MEARSHCDTAGAHGIKETIVTVQNLLETRLHGGTVANHGTTWKCVPDETQQGLVGTKDTSAKSRVAHRTKESIVTL